jgi:hypothetical protein
VHEVEGDVAGMTNQFREIADKVGEKIGENKATKQSRRAEALRVRPQW